MALFRHRVILCAAALAGLAAAVAPAGASASEPLKENK